MKPQLLSFLKIATLLIALPNLAVAQVGMQNIQFGNLPVTLIYPTAEKAAMQTMGAFQIDVAMNAKPRAGNQRLVVMSHGSGGSPISDHQLAATLAKAGYLVAQPLHAGDNYQDVSQAGPESWKTRPTELTETIDALAKDKLWSSFFDADKVGVHGMSAGGVTALAVAGGQWNLLTLIQHCGNNMNADLGFCLNGLQGNRAGQIARQAQFKLGAHTPEIYLPDSLKNLHGTKDLRVKAVSLAVPVVAPFTSASLAALTIPLAVVGAANDEVLAPAFHSNYLLAHCKRSTLLIDLKNAGHFDTLAPWPEVIAKEVANTQIRGGLPHPHFDPPDRARAFGLIAQFFNNHLK
jgi:predicted dienelactone hydrolase